MSTNKIDIESVNARTREEQTPMTMMCESCNKEQETTEKVTIKENGVLGYYNRNVEWCKDCVKSHNRHLLESWG